MVKQLFKLLIYILFWGCSWQPVFAQTLNPDSLMMKAENLGRELLYRNHDSTYIASYAEDLTIKLLSISKINFFKISDKGNDTNIRFRPDRQVNLGLGIAYKWFALDLAFNFGIGERSDFKNREAFDFQGTIFSSKQYISGSLQYYYGYQYDDFKGIPNEDIPEDDIRDDIRTISTVIQYLFAFDYDKFSLKAPFIQNEIQRKSAGSWLIGARFELYSVDSDSSMVPASAQEYFNDKVHLINLTGANLTFNFGYMYTLVFLKKFYATLGLIPGIGMNLGDYKSDFKEPLGTQLSTGFTIMSSVGYNTPKWFTGLQLITDNFGFKIDDGLRLNQGQGKIKFNIGYRFGKH